MGPSSGTNGGAKKPAPRRGKPKPKFEVPPEVSAAPAAPWAWHAGEAAPVKPLVVASAAAPAQRPAPAKAPIDSMLDPASVMLAAIETMAQTVAASTRLMLAAASVLGAPLEVTRKILGL